MSVELRNLDALQMREIAYGARFATRFADLARPMGAKKLGFNVQEIPPGRASVPYHSHYANEELVVVLEGEPRIRLEGAQHDLGARDVVALPPGATSAHQLLNYGARAARVLLASTMIPHELVEYPDSGKRMFALSGLSREPAFERLMLRGDRARAMPATGDLDAYFAGEPFDEPLGDPPPVAPERDPRITNLDAVPWEPYELGSFRAERRRVARRVGARLLGYSVYRVQPGERAWPYHFQHVNEEMFLVRAGHARLRTPEGEREVGRGDVILCPPGPGGAHVFEGVGEEPFEMFALSTMIEPEVAEYPDSAKIYVMVGAAPGADVTDRPVDLVFRRKDAVPYEDGEA